MTEKTLTIHLDLSLQITVGPDCDGGEELRKISFADITDGPGIDLSGYERNGSTVLQDLTDKLPEVIMAKYREEMRCRR